jgi:hypothetical protein
MMVCCRTPSLIQAPRTLNRRPQRLAGILQGQTKTNCSPRRVYLVRDHSKFLP